MWKTKKQSDPFFFVYLVGIAWAYMTINIDVFWCSCTFKFIMIGAQNNLQIKGKRIFPSTGV